MRMTAQNSPLKQPEPQRQRPVRGALTKWLRLKRTSIMSTRYLDALNALNCELARILAGREIVGVPQSDEARATEAEAFAGEVVPAVTQAMDRFLCDLFLDADDHIGAMTDIERKDAQRIVTTAVEDEHDYPFRRFAESVWAGLPITIPSETLGAAQLGVTTRAA